MGGRKPNATVGGVGDMKMSYAAEPRHKRKKEGDAN
jgi:hypothetical protein